MARPLALLPDATAIVPCGLVADRGCLPLLEKRRASLAGFRIVQADGRLVLYHPTLLEPDLPFLGQGVSYLRRYGQGLYGPVGTQLNVPDRLLGPLHGELSQSYALAGDILFEAGPPLGVCDISHSVAFERADLGALV